MATRITIEQDHDLLTPAEVAALWRVDIKTLSRWALTGRIPGSAFTRTLGGHRRYYRAAIEELLNGGRS